MHIHSDERDSVILLKAKHLHNRYQDCFAVSNGNFTIDDSGCLVSFDVKFGSIAPEEERSPVCEV